MNEPLKIFVTRRIPEIGIMMLKEKGYDVVVSEKDGVLTKEELKSALSAKPYDAVLCLLTDTIDAEVFAAAPEAKVFANYAVGYNNIDLHAAKERNVIITNTPGVLTETVAEYALAMIMALTKRIVEADSYLRAGKFEGWEPELFWVLICAERRSVSWAREGSGRRWPSARTEDSVWILFITT